MGYDDGFCILTFWCLSKSWLLCYTFTIETRACVPCRWVLYSYICTYAPLQMGPASLHRCEEISDTCACAMQMGPAFGLALSTQCPGPWAALPPVRWVKKTFVCWVRHYPVLSCFQTVGTMDIAYVFDKDLMSSSIGLVMGKWPLEALPAVRWAWHECGPIKTSTARMPMSARSVKRGAHMHRPPVLSTCTAHTHSPHAPPTCTAHMHCSHAQPTCTVHMHHPHAPPACTANLYCPPVLSTCTAHLYFPHALPTCTAHMHRPSVLPTCTAHMHRPSVLPTSTAHLYCPYAPPTCTACVCGCRRLAALCWGDPVLRTYQAAGNAIVQVCLDKGRVPSRPVLPLYTYPMHGQHLALPFKREL